MVQLDQLWLAGVGIFKRSYTCHNTMVVELVEAHFENADWAVSFEKDGTKIEAFGKVSNKGVLQARLRQLMPDSCSERKKTARGMSFQLHGYQKLILRFGVANYMDQRGKKAEVV